jgi:hypothetical protein
VLFGPLDALFGVQTLVFCLGFCKVVQLVHAPAAPVFAAKYPRGQLVQPVEPLVAENVPAEQLTHWVIPGLPP